MNRIAKWFAFAEHQTNWQTECLAGVTTYLTMAYIVLVVPALLAKAGIPVGAAFVATCWVTAIGSLLCGLLANYPIVVAPGIPLVAYFTYVLVDGQGFPWSSALGATFLAGGLFTLVALTPVRRWLIQAIPETLNMAIAAGLGFFIAMLGLKMGGVIRPDSQTIVALGDFHHLPTVFFLLGFCLIVALDFLKVRGSLVIGIVVISLLGMLFGDNQFHGVVSMPPDMGGTFAALQFHDLLTTPKGLSTILAIFLVTLFDTTGTLVGILHQAGLYKKGCDKMSRGLLAASISSMAAGVLGASSTSAYCESASGVKAGGRTGLTAVTVGLLFILTLFISPLAAAVPTYAAAAALVYVGCLMMQSFVQFNWQDITDSVPSTITALGIPLSFSVSDGLGLGFISYVLIKVMAGKARRVHPMLYVLSAVFMSYFLFAHTR